MQAQLQLRRPQNWPDFEMLCKKLWGEIWECPEIKKNGRAGKEQHGVDVYGIPKDESQYYGIQCKGKDEYTHKQFSKKEIDDEIKKAKNFQPALKKLYFATTAVKDSKIEEYVRKKDLENRDRGLFEVHLFSWEDIVELIDENKQTHDWYVKSQNFKTTGKIKVTFKNNSEELEIVVPFLKKVVKYTRKLRNMDDLFAVMLKDAGITIPSLPNKNPWSQEFNESCCRFKIFISNDGNNVIEKLKLFMTFEGEFESVQTCSKGHWFSEHHSSYNTFIDEKTKSGSIKPFSSHDPLVQKDCFSSDTICLKPLSDKPSEVFIHWSIISKDYNDEGRLLLKIKPELRIKEETIIVDNVADERIEEKIEDLIT